MIDILKYEIIDGDMTDITGRLKEIDSSYFVLRERKSGKLQIHSSAQRGGTLALALPYDRLDCRALELVRKTRSERADALFRETELQNEKIKKLEADELVKKSERRFEQLLKGGKDDVDR